MLQVCRKPHSQLQGLCEVKGGQGGICYVDACWTQQEGNAPSLPVMPKAKWAGYSAEESLEPGWNHSIHGVCIVGATLPIDPQPTPGPVTEAPTLMDIMENYMW
jgi:hypothetical protein